MSTTESPTTPERQVVAAGSFKALAAWLVSQDLDQLDKLLDNFAPRRTITIDIETGAWVGNAYLQGEEGARVAASVLPGMPIEEIKRAYGLWMEADPAPGEAVWEADYRAWVALDGNDAWDDDPDTKEMQRCTFRQGWLAGQKVVES